ncbi:MAG TPA: DivIVA domain-containing protein [Acidimicrobiales bacterium]|jgi:cell division septum initiation protein DivIVA|nr:DivIVA domain-containing protein [Acidimicrobiales bacterium]
MASDRHPDASDPEAVGRAEFATSFRGFDQMQVRAYLKVVARELQRLHGREDELEQRLAELEEQLAEATRPEPELDEALLTARLGEETARVLQTARAAAVERVRRAEADAAEIQAIAEADAERIRSSAQAAVDAEIDAARTQGLELVAEARLARERMLEELARRRRVIRIQVEQLRAGRDRLVQSHDALRRALDDVTRELDSSLPEARAAAELVGRRMQSDAPPSAAQLEAEIESAKLAGLPIVSQDEIEAAVVEEPARWVNEPVILTSPADLGVEEPAASDAAPRPEVHTDEIPVLDHFGDAAKEEILLADVGRHSRREHAGLPREPVPIVQPADDVEEVRRVEAQLEVELVVGDAASDLIEPDIATPSEPDSTTPSEPPSAVDDLFARIRESRAESVARAQDVLSRPIDEDEPTASVTPDDSASEESLAESAAVEESSTVEDSAATEDAAVEVDAAAETETDMTDDAPPLEGDAALFAARDAALAKIAGQVTRKLKRLLSDEQNEIQDLVRRQRGKVHADEVVGRRDHHVGRYVAAVGGELLAAVSAGASFYDPTGVPGDADLSTLDERLALDLLDPLRHLLTRGVDEADAHEDELLDRVRAAYREVKAQRAEGAARGVTLAAFNLGIVAAQPAGAGLRWTLDPVHGCSPDCDDNSLAGPVVAGEAFPTGAIYPPDHPGCRCLLVPAEQ